MIQEFLPYIVQFRFLMLLVLIRNPARSGRIIRLLVTGFHTTGLDITRQTKAAYPFAGMTATGHGTGPLPAPGTHRPATRVTDPEGIAVFPLLITRPSL
jgi:hypothetical protein